MVAPRSLRARLTVIAATAIAASVFVAFQVASQLLGWELQDSAEGQLRADARVLATNARRAGLAEVQLPPYPGSGRLVRVVLPDGSTRTPVGQPALPPVSEQAERVAQGASADLMESGDSDEDGHLVYTLRAGDGAVQVAQVADDSPINQFGFGMLLIGLLCVFGGALVGRAVARTGLAPIDRLTAVAVRVARTRDLDADIPDEGGGEIRRLIRSINDMLAALRDSRRAQRLLAEDAAHELKTPLTSLRLNVELLIRLDRRGTLDSALPAASRTRLLNDLGAQVAELSTLVAELTDLARGDVGDESTELLDLADVVAAAVTRARSRAPEVEVALDVTSVWVSGRPAALGRAVLNLLDNAGKWSPWTSPSRSGSVPRAPRRYSRSTTPGRASTPPTYRGCSTGSTVPTAPGRCRDQVWGCRSCSASSTPTAAGPSSPVPHAVARCFGSTFRPRPRPPRSRGPPAGRTPRRADVPGGGVRGPCSAPGDGFARLTGGEDTAAGWPARWRSTWDGGPRARVRAVHRRGGTPRRADPEPRAPACGAGPKRAVTVAPTTRSGTGLGPVPDLVRAAALTVAARAPPHRRAAADRAAAPLSGGTAGSATTSAGRSAE